MNTSSPSTPADAELFQDAISCELALPAEFRLGTGITRAGAAESVLRGIAQVEDLRGDETSEERGELPQAIARVEAKLDLILALIGQLARQSGHALPLRPVRWSRRGIRLEIGPRSGAVPGAAGTLALQPADWLPETIELPVTLLAEAASGNGGFFLWLRFSELGAGVEAALERHLFRLHRRQVADARRLR
ncbi:MAG: PilZ domain-containing protein [Pseudomonas sp.]